MSSLKSTLKTHNTSTSIFDLSGSAFISSIALLLICPLVAQSPLPRYKLTDSEMQQAKCLFEKYHMTSEYIGGLPDKPYVKWKGKKIYLNKEGCE